MFTLSTALGNYGRETEEQNFYRKFADNFTTVINGFRAEHEDKLEAGCGRHPQLFCYGVKLIPHP